MKKTILVTGGSGFIGQSFVSYVLKNTQHNVVVLDSLTYAADQNRLFTRPEYSRERVRFYWHDLRAPINQTLASRIGHIDYVVNIASESHVDRSIADPAAFFMNNCALAANMLEYARIAKPEVFVQVSTDEVYGPAEQGYAHKEWDPHIPSNPYAASKSAQESLAISYWRTFGVPVVITNTMNNFGEHQHPEKFVPLCVNSILNGSEITVHGGYNGSGDFVSGSRFWLHADNHASAILYILQNLPPNQYPQHSRPSRWNVVGNTEVSNLNIVNRVSELLGRPANVKLVDFHSSRPGHDLRYGLDGGLLHEAGWVAPVNFEDSFSQTVLGLAKKAKN
jgi:dTDP-glucose 4,6-dehydratase